MGADISSSANMSLLVPTRVRWTSIAPTLLVVWIISMFDKSNMAIVMNDPSFLGELGLAGQQAKLGWLSSGLFLAYGICAPLWGFVVQRYGPRLTCVLSLLVWAATCFWSGVAHNYEQLLLSRIVLGAGEAALYPLTLALVANWFALKERGRATSFWWIGTMIGPMLVGLVVTSLIVVVGWRWQCFSSRIGRSSIAEQMLRRPISSCRDLWRTIRTRRAVRSTRPRAHGPITASG
jgi:MFS family permease